MRKCVIFDLDGTLTRSEEGIWNCVRYAAEKLGFPVPDAATLEKCRAAGRALAEVAIKA